jgi:hypothetical protein
MPRLLYVVTLLVVTLMVATACAQLPPELAPAPAAEMAHTDEPLSAEAEEQLTVVRELTGPFVDFAQAEAAGWSERLTDCMENPAEGAQGYHYGNVAYIDGETDLMKPEVLMYEPQEDGQLRLVGVEYIVPFAVLPPTAEPPSLFGREFHQNHDAELWALHLWLWQDSPSGLFADWNAGVSCAAAES